MKETKMYKERVANIAAFRGCDHNCIYCAFRGALRWIPCEKCRSFKPHEHLECFDRSPPKMVNGDFITIGLCGDVAFASDEWFNRAIEYCKKWSDRTFFIQSKNPKRFLPFDFPSNVILGTTVESNIYHPKISNAPKPIERLKTMWRLTDRCDNRIIITVEPILKFDEGGFVDWIHRIGPWRIYVGYNSRTNIRLPEPTLEDTFQLIERFAMYCFDVKVKLVRKAWYE